MKYIYIYDIHMIFVYINICKIRVINAYTPNGRKFALLEGLSHDLVCAGSNYHVHFTWQVWHGQYSPGFKFNKQNSFSRGDIDRNHVDLKDPTGKGFALRRLNKQNFCPGSVYMLDT